MKRYKVEKSKDPFLRRYQIWDRQTKSYVKKADTTGDWYHRLRYVASCYAAELEVANQEKPSEGDRPSTI